MNCNALGQEGRGLETREIELAQKAARDKSTVGNMRINGGVH